MAPDNSKRCFHCGGRGHMARECTEPKVIDRCCRNRRREGSYFDFSGVLQATKTCFLCAMPGHEIRDCHNEICFNCDQPGHKARDCHLPHRPRIYCNYCQKVGHTIQECDAHRYRKLAQQPQKKTMYCFNCGAAGHFGWDCPNGGSSRGGGGGGNYYTPQPYKRPRFNDGDRRSWT